MAEITERLRGELSDVLEVIRRAGGGVVFEECPGDLEENALPPDEADAGRAGEARKASYVTQRMLIDEANRLAETLDRLRRGECGISEETRELVNEVRMPHSGRVFLSGSWVLRVEAPASIDCSVWRRVCNPIGQRTGTDEATARSSNVGIQVRAGGDS